MGLKKIKLLIFAVGIAMVFFNFFLILPGSIYCDSSLNENITVCDGEFAGENLLSSAKPASPGPDTYFYPVIITSVIVIGILVFAMWQTFRTKRHS